jgi:hypothetical protein
MALARSRSVVVLAFVLTITGSAGAAPWVSTGPVGGAARGFAVDPTNPLIVYAAAADAGGVYKTSDGGATWTAVNTGLPTQIGGFPATDFTAIAVDPTTPATVYVGRSSGSPAASTSRPTAEPRAAASSARRVSRCS